VQWIPLAQRLAVLVVTIVLAILVIMAVPAAAVIRVDG
jgi:hypothetical protein